ncbi:hypothetical protein CC2G_008671 [Coprinopsis cinerea AmutBmut pab1-1]|nr:hypothetical protein CC2G_008671 [Coprinopsis cinerea AmutBmut pab1-1]
MVSNACINCKSAGATKRCARCQKVWYCSPTCQNSHWKFHKEGCIPEHVTGVTIYCNGERKPERFSGTRIHRSDAVFGFGYVTPVPARFGVPLLIFRKDSLPEPFRPWRGTEQDPSSLDNQEATYLMISTQFGLAPLEWQCQVGTVTVVRADYKPLTPAELETIWAYISHLISNYYGLGDRDPDGSVARAQMTKEKFLAFSELYKEECIKKGRAEFKNLVLPIGK